MALLEWASNAYSTVQSAKGPLKTLSVLGNCVVRILQGTQCHAVKVEKLNLTVLKDIDEMFMA